MYLLAVTDGTTIIQVHSRRCLKQLDNRKLSRKLVEGWLILGAPCAQRVALPRGQAVREGLLGSLALVGTGPWLLSTSPLGAQLGF